MDLVFALLAPILLSFTVLGTGAISGLYSERSGVIDIGIEGYMIFGGLVYALAGLWAHDQGMTGVWLQIPLFLVSFFVTMIIGLLHAFASVTLKANQVVSGIAINLLAAGIAVYVVNVLYQSGVSGISNTVDSLKIATDFGLSISLLITILIFILTFLLLTKSRYGLRLKAAGENPHALEAQGISVAKTRYQAVLISAGLGGLAGAFFVQWQGVFHGSANGLGYISLAILIFGRWRIQWVLLSAIFFSILYGLAAASISSLDLPAWFSRNANILNAAPFIISLVAIVALSKWSQAPKANGIPYDRSSR